jgi:hypothetical protein
MLGDNQDHHHMIFVFTFVPMKSVPIITKVNLISMVRCNLIQLYKVMFCHRFFPVSSTTDTMIQMKYCWHTINPIKHNPKLSSRSFSYQTGVCHQGHSLIKLESVIKVILLSQQTGVCHQVNSLISANWSLSSRSFSYLSIWPFNNWMGLSHQTAKSKDTIKESETWNLLKKDSTQSSQLILTTICCLYIIFLLFANSTTCICL